jgi:hypothetical protein
MTQAPHPGSDVDLIVVATCATVVFLAIIAALVIVFI